MERLLYKLRVWTHWFKKCSKRSRTGREWFRFPPPPLQLTTWCENQLRVPPNPGLSFGHPLLEFLLFSFLLQIHSHWVRPCDHLNRCREQSLTLHRYPPGTICYFFLFPLVSNALSLFLFCSLFILWLSSIRATFLLERKVAVRLQVWTVISRGISIHTLTVSLPLPLLSSLVSKFKIKKTKLTRHREQEKETWRNWHAALFLQLTSSFSIIEPPAALPSC